MSEVQIFEREEPCVLIVHFYRTSLYRSYRVISM